MRTRALRAGAHGLAACALLILAACAVPTPATDATKAGDAQWRAGQEFDDCNGDAACPRMVVIPAGKFVMGVPADEAGFNAIEGPQRSVSLRRFAVGKFAVTRGEWAAFVAATNSETRTGCMWDGRAQDDPDPRGSWRDLGFAQDDQHPVVCVGWDEIQSYLGWLRAKTHHDYRLLTEAEWEYAARAGTTTPYPWGAGARHEFANYGADQCCSPLVSGRDQWAYTAPVGSFPPNAFGLYDMHGNVLQFVQDCFAGDYAGLATDGSAFARAAPLRLSGDLAELSGMNTCAFRMLRGGDWGDPPEMIRSGFRNFAPPPPATLADYRSGGVGFRVARSL